MLRLEEYGPCLVSQGYSSVQEVATISIEDLEDTGFYRLGHQKRLTLGIRRLKELSRSGSCPPAPPVRSQEYYPHPSTLPQQPQYMPQSQEIHVPHPAQPMAVKQGSFSSFSSPFPSRKMVSLPVEHHHYHDQFNRSDLRPS